MNKIKNAVVRPLAVGWIKESLRILWYIFNRANILIMVVSEDEWEKEAESLF